MGQSSYLIYVLYLYFIVFQSFLVAIGLILSIIRYMIRSHGILLVWLLAGGFALFRWYSGRTATSNQARLASIRKASSLFRWSVGVGGLFGVYALVAFFAGWPFFSEYPAKLAVSEGHVYASPGEMPQNVLALSLVKTALDLAALAVLFALFGLYARGILFSARNVLYLRLQGYYFILGFVVDYQLGAALRDVHLSVAPLFSGLIIIFVAWIMDEGRKMKEEQELMV